MRKMQINPQYEYLRPFVESIPDIFDKEGKTIYKSRNTIKVITTQEGLRLNVKRYHIPHGLNHLIYSWGIRKPKGERAYEYATILKSKCIETPDVIALIEERSALGILGLTYLITLQCDYGHTMYETGDKHFGDYHPIAKALARFAANIHEQEILHKDFTPGNVLWKEDDRGFHFMLVDINRMDFGPVSIPKGLYNLRKFWGPKEFMRTLVTEYALLRNTDPSQAVAYVMREREKFWTHYQKKHPMPFKLEL